MSNADPQLIEMVADTIWDTLDQMYLMTGEPYVSPANGQIEGEVDMDKVADAVIKKLEDEGLL